MPCPALGYGSDPLAASSEQRASISRLRTGEDHAFQRPQRQSTLILPFVEPTTACGSPKIGVGSRWVIAWRAGGTAQADAAAHMSSHHELPAFDPAGLTSQVSRARSTSGSPSSPICSTRTSSLGCLRFASGRPPHLGVGFPHLGMFGGCPKSRVQIAHRSLPGAAP